MTDENGVYKVTDTFVRDLAEHFRAQKLLPRRYVIEMLKQILGIFKAVPNLVSVRIYPT